MENKQSNEPMPSSDPPSKCRRVETNACSTAASPQDGHAKHAATSLPRGAFSAGYQRRLHDDNVLLAPPALHHAVSFGTAEDVALLIRHGADVNATPVIPAGCTVTDWCRAPLHAAADHGHADMAKLLLENGANVKAVDAESGSTALHDAVEHGHVAVVNVLLDHGADVNAKNRGGCLPIHHVTGGWNRDKAAAIAEILLDRGADVAATDEAGYPLLHAAARQGRDDVVKVLIDHGANVNAEIDRVGPDVKRRPLHLAAREGTMAVIEVLLRSGADVNATESTRKTPLHIAISMGRADVAQKLLDNGADVNCKTVGGESPLHLAAETGRITTAQVLLSNGANVNAKDDYGRTPLFTASGGRNAWVGLVNLLLSSGADVNAKSSLGGACVALQSVSRRERNGAAIAQSLLAAGADVNFCHDASWPLLHLAARTGHISTAEVLLENGAAVNAVVEGTTALHFAARRGRSDHSQLLIRHGALFSTTVP